MGLVVENNKSVRVVEVSVGEDVVGVHDVGSKSGSSVALLVEDKHETKVDNVSLSVMDVESVLDLD